ncbi:hypothetical protein M5689_022566 [Euphorbia peplus]|nr:hypothetical protein M5689_022566 [Euphorbia peplus]
MTTGTSTAGHNLKELSYGEEIVKRYKGLPLAAKVLGGLVRDNVSLPTSLTILDISGFKNVESISRGVIQKIGSQHTEENMGPSFRIRFRVGASHHANSSHGTNKTSNDQAKCSSDGLIVKNSIYS